MKAALFKKLLAPLKVEHLPDPTPGPNEVVVEVCRCGICGSDLHLTEDAIFAVPAGAVLGHEYAGRVAAIGRDVDRGLIGEHVAVFPDGALVEPLTVSLHGVKELKIQASAFYEVRDFELAADVLDRQGDAPRAMVTDVVGLDAMPDAFEAPRKRTTQCKVLVDPFR